MVSWSFTFIQKISGVGGKLTRAVYLAPRLVFWKYLIACKFFNIIFKGNIKFKDFIHNFIRAGVAYIKASVNLLILKGGGQAVQGGLSCPPPIMSSISHKVDARAYRNTCIGFI